MKYTAIILAAGSGKRTGLKINKILHEINGKRVIEYSLDFFKLDKNCIDIILVASSVDFNFFVEHYNIGKAKVVLGGDTRQDSVRLALGNAECDYVLIHDGARPYITKKSVDHILASLSNNPSVTLGVKVKETIQEVEGNYVVKTLDRSNLIITQTPQGFNKKILIEAHDIALKREYYGTDDTVLLEEFMYTKAAFIEGDYRNIKLTTIGDIKLLEVILF